MPVSLVYGLVPPWSSGKHAHVSWWGSQDQIPEWTWLAYQEKHSSVSQQDTLMTEAGRWYISMAKEIQILQWMLEVESLQT